ncbi:MAG: penicillin-binding protein 2 [Parasphingorhabdus sp.]
MNGGKVISSAVQSLTFTRRATIIGGLQVGIGLLLAGRMAYISVAENERYQLLSESNRVNLTLIPPRRGWLVDRNGKPIANNRSDFRVDIIPDRTPNKEQTVATLAKLLSLDAEEVERINNELKQTNSFQPIQVASGLDWEKYAAVSVRLPDLPGVSPRQGFSRFYPTGAAVGHLVGYVGIASAEDYKENPNPILITPGYKIGKDGLEKHFEDRLQGEPGAKRVEVTARGKIIRELDTQSDVPGKPLKLTLDAELQEYAARRLGPESGSVVVMDCHTGEILTMTSMPSFDPNSFSDGIGVTEYGMLRDDDHVPLRDKSLRGLYPPGSTVKPMDTLALMRAGIDPEETVSCPGGLRVGNRFFNCHSTHGSVNMNRAVAQSCDTYFYKMALRIGYDPIAKAARELGMGEKYDLPVPSQSYGTVPDSDWMERKHKRPWANFDSVNSVIGQGYVLSNPLQLAVMASRMASGKKVQPRLLFTNKKIEVPAINFSQEHLMHAHQAMADVVSGRGTARRASLPLDGIRMGGKTGTAQVVGLNVGRGGRDVPWKFRDHGLFIAFAPVDNPRYAMSVVIEHGAGSSSAYPVARDVMTFMFDREKAMEQLEPLEKSWGGNIAERTAKKMTAYRAQKELEKAIAEGRIQSTSDDDISDQNTEPQVGQ